MLWHVDFGIAYDADIDLARSIILDEIDKHPDVMHDQDRKVMVLELSDFSEFEGDILGSRQNYGVGHGL